MPGGAITEVVFNVPNGDSFLGDAAAVAECTFELEFMIPRSDGHILEHILVTGAYPDPLTELLEERPEVASARVLHRNGSRARLEIVTNGAIEKALAARAPCSRPSPRPPHNPSSRSRCPATSTRDR